MELEDLGRLVAELAARALAELRDLGARRGQRSVQPRVLRGDLGFVDGAVRDRPTMMPWLTAMPLIRCMA
ncbi:MAG: hypothetical protein EBU31_18390 [Proteobacteria bacterium]|nr:hypothetical protein [Pseudomonadota bacterium]